MRISTCAFHFPRMPLEIKRHAVNSYVSALQKFLSLIFERFVRWETKLFLLGINRLISYWDDRQFLAHEVRKVGKIKRCIFSPIILPVVQQSFTVYVVNCILDASEQKMKRPWGDCRGTCLKTSFPRIVLPREKLRNYVHKGHKIFLNYSVWSAYTIEVNWPTLFVREVVYPRSI